jgi:predicted NUDIX family NTP pyrophosphohydrolase
VAKREFEEETGIKPISDSFIKIGEVSRPGKTVHFWAFEGDVDVSKIIGNTIEIEWPPRSEKKIEIPEVDRGEFFTLEKAEAKLYEYMRPILGMFKERLSH